MARSKKKKLGRRSAITRRALADYCKALVDGSSIADAATVAGFSVRTAHNYLSEGREHREKGITGSAAVHFLQRHEDALARRRAGRRSRITQAGRAGRIERTFDGRGNLIREVIHPGDWRADLALLKGEEPEKFDPKNPLHSLSRLMELAAEPGPMREHWQLLSDAIARSLVAKFGGEDPEKAQAALAAEATELRGLATEADVDLVLAALERARLARGGEAPAGDAPQGGNGAPGTGPAAPPGAVGHPGHNGGPNGEDDDGNGSPGEW